MSDVVDTNVAPIQAPIASGPSTAPIAPIENVSPIQVSPIAEVSTPQPEISPIIESTTIQSEQPVLDASVKAETAIAPVEVKVETETNQVQPQIENIVQEIKFEPFKAPEGSNVDLATFDFVTKRLTDFVSKTKVDTSEVQKLGQDYIDSVLSIAQEVQAKTLEAQKQADDAKREKYKQDFLNDPFIGGNRKDTTINAANEWIKTHGGDANQQQEFASLMKEYGLDFHPVVLRTLSYANKNMAEGKMLAANNFPKPSEDKYSKWYGKST